MGIMDFLKNKQETPQTKVNLLKEREMKVGVCLAKKSSTEIKARVNFMIDISGSMGTMFSSGKVQEVLERIFPIALKLDDNKELDVWAFNNLSCYVKPSVTMSNFNDYVSKYVPRVSGGTSYAPVMKDIVQVCGKDSSAPCFNIMITDGDNSDKIETESFIKEISNKHHFWQFVGIGYEFFNFLQKLDTLTDRYIDNANFFSINDINSVSDEQLYDKLLNEFPSWLKEAKNKSILL